MVKSDGKSSKVFRRKNKPTKELEQMKQELNFTLQFILFALTELTGLAVLIFVLRKNKRKEKNFSMSLVYKKI